MGRRNHTARPKCLSNRPIRQMNLCLWFTLLSPSRIPDFRPLPGRKTVVRKLSCTPQLQRSKMGCYGEPVSDEGPTNSYHPTRTLQYLHPAGLANSLCQARRSLPLAQALRSLLSQRWARSLCLFALTICSCSLPSASLSLWLPHTKLHTKMEGSSIFSLNAPGR